MSFSAWLKDYLQPVSIMQSWRESMALLAPANIKLFLLITVRSVSQTYKLLATVPLFLSLLARAIIIGCANSVLQESNLFRARICLGILVALAMSQVLSIFVLAARPSIQIKNIGYFYARWNALWTTVLSTVVLDRGNFFYIPGLYMPGTVIALFFFFDTQGSAKDGIDSTFNTIKMVVFTLPVIIVFTGLLWGLMWLLFLGIGSNDFFYASFASVFVVIPVSVNVWSNLYIKRLHEQPSLYFNLPK